MLIMTIDYYDLRPLSCIITGGPAPILRSIDIGDLDC